MAENILESVCSSAKLDRDKGLVELQRFLGTLDAYRVHELENKLLLLLSDSSSTWERRIGALMGSRVILTGSPDLSTEEFSTSLREKCVTYLEDPEFRVRIAAGETLGALARHVGPEVYLCVKQLILSGVQTNIERDLLPDTPTSDYESTEKLVEKLGGSPKPGRRRNSADASQIFHDTAGWKNLETWMKCLQSVIEGCSHNFNPYIDQELLDLIFKALTHTNRFVRETGYYVCASLVACGMMDDENAVLAEENAIYQHGHQFAEYLGRGLADNWSQVRLASSVATRKFLNSLPFEEARHSFYPILIPRMCLNRYYVAEGVRIYSQDTWRQITHGEGKQLVEKYIDKVVDVYIEQTEADNHAVREAACACIAELGSKIDTSCVSQFIPRLLDALIVCFNDDSWPVRDAACVACGNFIFCFPEESRASVPSLYPLFYGNLQDNIPSVRQGAAVALANLVRAYGQESVECVIPTIKEGLTGLEHQSADTEKYSGLDKGPATYGVVKRLRDNDMNLHTGQTMYSCGSLAPKMSRGKRDGGCMDHQFRRPAEPWELAEGCIHLVAELSHVSQLQHQVSELLPLVAKAASLQHYTQHVAFLETLCKQLPNIAKGLGKRHFKMYIEIFFDSIFYSLSSDNALTSSAASQCLNQLSSFLGPCILRGRVEQYNIRYLEQLDANQFIAPL